MMKIVSQDEPKCAVYYIIKMSSMSLY